MTSCTGRSRGSVSTAEIASTTAREASSVTAPKIVCLPWSHSVGAVVMKNCEPLVPLPRRRPALHGQDVGGGEGQGGVDLVVEDVAGSSGTVTQRVTALDHETGDDAVEDDVVVQRSVGLRAGAWIRPRLLAGGQPHEVGDGLRSLLGVELQADITEVGVKSRFHE